MAVFAQLKANVGPSSTMLSVKPNTIDLESILSVGDLIQIGDEIIKVVSFIGPATMMKVSRGEEGTTAVLQQGGIDLNKIESTPPVVYGCMDPNATNYNSNATQDDGSCEYAPPPLDGDSPVASFTMSVVSTGPTEVLDLMVVASVDGNSIGDPIVDSPEINPGTTIILNGGISTPSDSLSFLWTQLSGPAVLLTNITSPITAFVAPSQLGMMVFSLKITHPVLGQKTQSVSIDVIDIPGTQPMASFIMEKSTTQFPSGLTLIQMKDILHSLGYLWHEDLDVTAPIGIIDYLDGQELELTTGDSRPLEFIHKAISTGNSILFEIFFPPAGTDTDDVEIFLDLDDAVDYPYVSPDITTEFDTIEGHDKITTNKLNQIKYFSDGNSAILKGSDVYTSSLSSSNTPYYYGVTDGDPTSPRFDTQFNVAWGHYAGSGSNTRGDTVKGSSEAIYKQYSSMLLDIPKNGFLITSGSDVYPGQTTLNKDKSVYILNFKRNRFKDQLQEGNWTLILSGSHNSTAKTIHLTDNSVDNLGGVPTKVGRRYDILSGSNGIPQESILFNRYGWFYPDAGVMVFGEKLSNQMSESAESIDVGVFDSDSNSSRQLYPKLSSNSDDKNALRFINCLRNVAGGNCLTLYGEKETTDVIFICKVTTQEFNFTNNSTILSSSGDTMRKLEPGRRNGFNISTSYTGHDDVAYTSGSSTMDGNPHTFITQVHLHDNLGYPVAVAHLSKPLMKNFTKEAYIKVKLSY